MPLPQQSKVMNRQVRKQGTSVQAIYSPAQLIRERQLKAVLKYFSFSNNQQEKTVIFCAGQGAVKLTISYATRGPHVSENKLALQITDRKNAYSSRPSDSTPFQRKNLKYGSCLLPTIRSLLNAKPFTYLPHLILSVTS